MEFFFYSWNLISQVITGLGLFFHLRELDPVLWLVFVIGYLNLFASGYFLLLLLKNRQAWLRKATV